ncbi:uncharacterized protein [Antedon mediterranea]|uniref:uncharacterized protein n=1 Tax=Antedon mediterranea TaxID=105859 RepID=UPI003AF9C7F6
MNPTVLYIWLYFMYMRNKRRNTLLKEVTDEDNEEEVHLTKYQDRVQKSRRRFLRDVDRRSREYRRARLGRWVHFLTYGVGLGYMVDRRIWCKIRMQGVFWQAIIEGTFTEEDWKQNFRMKKTTFEYLCGQLHNRLFKSDTCFRKSISVKLKVAITLWRLGTNCEYRSIGHLFGVASSTACKIVIETCSAIVDVLQEQYIRFPEGQRLREVVAGFETQFGFPQCAGAIDGTHLPIIGPVKFHADYYNRKGFYSIIMQAVCDHQYRFTDIYIGWLGKVHDARVFANSPFYDDLCQGNLLPDLPKDIDGVQVPLVILGDPAYPLLPTVMKGYSDNGRLTERQVTFNYRLSRARMVIEGCFGRLKGRWRCLLKRNDTKLEYLPTQIAAACTLHNICELFGDEIEMGVANLDLYNEPVLAAIENNIEVNGPSGHTIREALANHFQREGI